MSEIRKKNSKNTKSRIVSAAWKLFYEQGYEDTTIEDIIYESQTSKGSFYHYFSGKDALLSSLSYLFDDKYEQLYPETDENENSFDVLMYLNHEVFRMIEDTVPIELLAMMYSSQLITKSEKHLLDHTRTYYKLLRKIVSKGIERDELIDTESVNDIVKAYAMCERSLLYDWCICNGEYSLSSYGAKMMPRFMQSYRKEATK